MTVLSERINYQEVGEGNKLLVLIHAFPVSNKLFEDIKDKMLPKGWKAYLPDLPGFGTTPDESESDMWTMEDFARKIFEIINDKSFDKIVIGGVSMGGYITQAFVKEFPRVSDALIFANTHDQADADGGEGRYEVVEKILNGRRQEYLEKDLLPKVIGDTTENERDDVIEKCWDMFATVSDQAIIRSMRGMAIRNASREDMQSLKIPILLITGEEDRISGKNVMGPMQNAYKNAQLVEIPKAGHYAAIENPELFGKTIKEFLDKI